MNMLAQTPPPLLNAQLYCAYFEGFQEFVLLSLLGVNMEVTLGTVLGV